MQLPGHMKGEGNPAACFHTKALSPYNQHLRRVFRRRESHLKYQNVGLLCFHGVRHAGVPEPLKCERFYSLSEVPVLSLGKKTKSYIVGIPEGEGENRFHF